MDKYNFQYCQKIVVYSKDRLSVLLCKRKDEPDFDATFSFIGGKLETTDDNIIEGLKREKNEEVGVDFKIRIFPNFTTNIHFVKKDGSPMILPHFYSIHESGSIQLNNDEYSEYKWVLLKDIPNLKNIISNIPDILNKFKILKEIINKTESILI
ncbi:NUDIX hydrolase [bacterium]|nr:NUDIX hydrolase [bacterium]